MELIIGAADLAASTLVNSSPAQVAAGVAAVAGVAAARSLYSTYVPSGSFRESERHGGELVAEVLEAHGVKFVFTLVGGHISPLLVASEKRGIRVIDVRHEVNAVFAADATSRLTGVPGVAAVTAGPGVTNTITAVKNAQMAQSALVLIGGAAATVLKGVRVVVVVVVVVVLLLVVLVLVLVVVMLALALRLLTAPAAAASAADRSCVARGPAGHRPNAHDARRGLQVRRDVRPCEGHPEGAAPGVPGGAGEGAGAAGAAGAGAAGLVQVLEVVLVLAPLPFLLPPLSLLLTPSPHVQSGVPGPVFVELPIDTLYPVR